VKPSEARAFFPALERYVWLTHGGGSPPSLRVREAVERAAARPFESEDPWGWTQEYYDDREALLATLGRMVGASAADVTLTRGTAQGLSFIRGLDWGPGDNVITARNEFPANLYPWLALQTRGVEVRMAEPSDGRIDAESVFRLMDEKTKAVALSLVQFWNGFRIDAPTIGTECRSNGVAFALDGAQAAGCVRIDVEELKCDLLAAGAIKWLQGPVGIGFCYVRDTVAERIDPPLVGLGSMASHEYFETNFEYAPGARRFQESACSFHDVAGFRAAVELLEEVGFDAIDEIVLDLSTYLGEGLAARGFDIVEPWPRKREESSGIVSFRSARFSTTEIVSSLAEAGVLAHARGDFVRFSPHYYNTREEMNRALDALPT
jgi:selenocysteine lyase/cysteine desulfurase